MMEYIKRTDEEGTAIECECCGYEAALSEFKCHEAGSSAMVMIPRLLCEVCASTHLAKAIHYPSQCHDADLRKAIGWIANRILDEIKGSH